MVSRLYLKAVLALLEREKDKKAKAKAQDVEPDAPGWRTISNDNQPNLVISLISGVHGSCELCKKAAKQIALVWR
jgi:hypothetical protein